MAASKKGFKFSPREIELIGYFLFRKVYSKEIINDPIMEFDVYEQNQLWRNVFDSTGKKEFYFYTQLKKKTKNGSRVDRTAGACGTWKSQKDNPIYYYPGGDTSLSNRNHIGSKRVFSFIPNNNNPNHNGRFVMHEFRLDGILLDDNVKSPCLNSNHRHDLVICRVKRERELPSSIRARARASADQESSSSTTSTVPSQLTITTPYLPVQVTSYSSVPVTPLLPWQYTTYSAPHVESSTTETNAVAVVSPFQQWHTEANIAAMPPLQQWQLSDDYTSNIMVVDTVDSATHAESMEHGQSDYTADLERRQSDYITDLALHSENNAAVVPSSQQCELSTVDIVVVDTEIVKP
ncbi:NAM domain-containing protein [Cephalotus follicularis]|uniref:NAM domain-containing protein n=1 Tax=Cephalotus follicularis TaxID=3775 RepID=A0A1Q3BFG0_CEPFO|nr:NAM domain-containing protein [Cephalotus follicularis]